MSFFLTFFLEVVLSFVALILPLLLAVAFFTLYERQLLAALQRRQGPNIVGFYGLFQPIADGLKLLLKESILPTRANLLIFILSPVFTFGLALAGWTVIPAGEGETLCDFHLGTLYTFALSSLGVHTVIMAGWSSNSKYAFLGGLRSAAQMISYEVSLGVTLLSVLLIAGSLNYSTIVESQSNIWLSFPLFPIFAIFFITALAETNRHPFDLPEAEAELVAGYNVEYSAMGFALFFLGEYANMLLMCALIVVLFLGGWYAPFLFSSFNCDTSLFFGLKMLVGVFFFVWARSTLPRYRYDQLMRLGWKVFLPLSFGWVTFVAGLVYSFSIFSF
jgi:NADH-quinone oxidoreductase subunit H